MDKRIRIAVSVVCVVVLVFSGAQILRSVWDYIKGDNTYDQATGILSEYVTTDIDHYVAEAVKEPEALPMPQEQHEPTPEDIERAAVKEYFKTCDFEELLKINPEVLGWIYVPGTEINYPFLQHDDNDYYLKHMYDNTPASVGSIFMDYRSRADFSDFNTVMYGHRMRNNSMFATLKYYSDKAFWEDHHQVYICTTDNKLYTYTIYSSFSGDPNGLSYIKGRPDEDTKKEFLSYTKRNAYYDTGITPETTDSFLTMSTCTGNGHSQRVIVHSYLTNTDVLDDSE